MNENRRAVAQKEQRRGQQERARQFGQKMPFGQRPATGDFSDDDSQPRQQQQPGSDVRQGRRLRREIAQRQKLPVVREAEAHQRSRRFQIDDGLTAERRAKLVAQGGVLQQFQRERQRRQHRQRRAAEYRRPSPPPAKANE